MNSILDDLTAENSLWDVYKLCRRIPENRFSKYTFWLTLILSLIYILLLDPTFADLVNSVRSLSDYAFSFAISILGFLVAGFTIFISINNRDLFIEFAKTQYPSAQMSYLKYSFCLFMNVFIHFLAFSAFCVSVKVLGSIGGPLGLLIPNIPTNQSYRYILVGVAFILLIVWGANLFSLLQSFIFNIYSLVMTSIRWDLEKSSNNTP